PSPGEFAEAYQSLIDDGADEILFVSIHGNLSGTLDSAKQAIELVEGARIATVDTRKVSMAQGIPAIRAAEFANNGGGLDEAITLVEDVVSRTRSLVIADTLEYLKKGGRLTQSQYLLGSMLRVKPILAIGEEPPYVTIATRVRTLKKALETMVNMANEDEIEWAGIVHGQGLENAEIVQALMKPLVGEVSIYEVTPVLGVHLGPGTVGLHWIAAKN
ncbi:MAG TPA: DegV family protein, partial [Dehalococcoidia bacterium]|nr:DegV family protein [Dehalococcoidia bacterium]